MSYALERSDRNLAEGLRRVALDQIDRALTEFDKAQEGDHSAVHQIRKRCKKLRGLIRLARPGFADYSRENKDIRDFSRMLSGLRDRAALIETHDRLMADWPEDRARFAPVRAQLTRQKPQVEATLDPDQRRTLERLRQRAACWTLRGKDTRTLRYGLERTWHRAGAAFAAARKSPDADAMHEWRKRVKYHWYHTRLLHRVWDAPMQAWRAEAKRLSDILGDHHDLAVYLAYLDSDAAPDVAPDTRAALIDRALASKSRLEHEAFALGHRFFTEKPKRLPNRWVKWWTVWRADTKAEAG